MGSVSSNQIGLRIQILNNNDDGSSNLNRFFTGTITLINSFETIVSNISISELNLCDNIRLAKIIDMTHYSCAGTHDVQDITYNIQDPVIVAINYIKNTEALGLY